MPSRVEQVEALEPMIGAAEAAEALGCNVRTLKRMAERGEVPGMQIGNRWRFLPSLLDQWRKGRMTSKCRDFRKEER